MLPNPNAVLAPEADVAPVPPCATGSWLPLSIKVASLKLILPALAVPLENLTIPVEELKSWPVPPYCAPIDVAVQLPDVTLPKRMSSSVELDQIGYY
jgi:hypothetical protein